MGAALDLIQRARDDATAIALHLMGEPNKRLSSRSELRWGDHGRYSLSLTGPRAGKWRDWKDEVGGDAMDMIEAELGLDRAEALQWIERWFGGSVEPVDYAKREREREKANAQAERETRRRVELAADIWSTSSPFRGSPAEAYVVKTRLKGLAIPDPVYRGGALRWNADEKVDGAIGAMIALMTGPVTGKSTGIHRTYIDANGQRIGRKMLGPKGVVRLYPDEAVTIGLSIGEGIESTISGALLTGQTPAWAALDAGNIASFPVLAGIECLSIFVDNDAGGTGQRAAEKCATRWYDAGRSTLLFTPKKTDADFNQILQEKAA